ncbi:NAD(P)-binding protein [Xylona heveae TC161]|uniref:NAD(P)-binding protein n=1 Tax=Xylona heveae (strain CBS 132557 / TC161) TaxID=1328760 RepID=A0A165AAB4_XYLHT|nr:NAD(P)-binding protein [Xylona heveae TC161]KZF20165.1 NAD(P)-binding protein [Xylona heveae TC161]
MENLPKDYFVTSQQFTKNTHRDEYPAINPSSEPLSQAGKVIVITGASKGLGRLGFAASFARASPRGIVIVGRNLERLKATAKEIRDINPEVDVLAVAADLDDPNSVTALWDKVKARFDTADVLVNNAGSFAPAANVADVKPDVWWSDFQTNVRGTFLVTQGFLELLGSQKKGNIINMSTSAALSVFPGLSSYSISKFAVIQLQAYVAAEYPNVTAVTLHPGIVKTDMTIDAFMPFADDTAQLVGGVGVWLATEQAKFLSGRYISANWDVEDLVARKDEIQSQNLLTAGLFGKFGKEQFD